MGISTFAAWLGRHGALHAATLTSPPGSCAYRPLVALSLKERHALVEHFSMKMRPPDACSSWADALMDEASWRDALALLDDLGSVARSWAEVAVESDMPVEVESDMSVELHV